MAAKILCGDVFDALPTLAAGSVDCGVTSPPYWALRSYLPKDHPLKPRELGSEPTPAEYVARMVEVFRLVRRAMSPWATCWVNVGDTFSTGGGADPKNANKGNDGRTANRHGRGIPEGNLCLIPQRLAIALQEDGWLVRSVIVWHKPAPMPGSMAGWRWVRCRVKVKEGGRGGNGRKRMMEGGTSAPTASSCTNAALAQWAPCPGCPRCEPNDGLVLRRGKWRPTSSWEPVLMLAKGPAYFSDGEAVKTPVDRVVKNQPSKARAELLNAGPMNRGENNPQWEYGREWGDMSGANLRDVWTIPAEPLGEKHYAAFPSELVYRCLAAGTSAKGYCPSCGAPWARVVESKFRQKQNGVKGGQKGLNELDGRADMLRGYTDTTTLGWRPSCSCCLVCDTMDSSPTTIRSPGNAPQEPRTGECILEGMEEEKAPEPGGKKKGKGTKKEAPADVRPVRDNVFGTEQGRTILYADLWGEMDVGERKGEPVQPSGGREIPIPVPAGSSDGGQIRPRPGTPPCDGEPFGEKLDGERSSPPHQRGQEGQPVGEPRCHHQAGARKRAHDQTAGHELTPYPPRPGRVLDPFSGSGRCGVQAQRLGLDFTGIELSPEYARMAERILERDGMPLFQE